MNRDRLIDALQNLPAVDQYSNIKFFKLLWTRLIEEDIPQDDADKIASTVEYDFSNISEDDDSLSEIATFYAEYCGKVYRHMKVNAIHDITPVLKYFKSPIDLKIDKICNI